MARNLHRIAATTLGTGVAALAIGAQPPCLPPSDDGRHPLFGALSIRAGQEFLDGQRRGAVPTSVAFGDLNADGQLDAVISANAGADAPEHSQIAVLIGRAGGVLEPALLHVTGLEAAFAAIADVDGDGVLDVLVCNASGDSVGIMRGVGDGTLIEQVSFQAGDEPRSLIAEDLDGDGDIDLAVLNTLSSDISILVNNGAGAFEPQVRHPIEFVTPRGNPNRNFPYPGPFLAAGDLDGDGDIDLAVPAIDRVHLLLNDGDGRFSHAPPHAESPTRSVYNVKLADFNGDGALDIAASIATSGVSRMVVWLNAGGGSFPEADEYDSSWQGQGPFYMNIGLTIADFDSDAMPDIAVSSQFFQNIPIHHNLGDGTFSDAQLHPTFARSWFVSAPDVNADGHDDLAILSTSLRGALRIRLADGAGSLIGPRPMPVGVPLDGNTSRHTISAADLDADGDQDLAVGVRNTSHILRRVEILENDGTGAFDRTGEIVLDDESAVADILATELDGNSYPEVLVADSPENGWIEPGVLWLLENNGGLAFSKRELFRFDDAYPLGLDAADFDGDGLRDVVAWVHGVYPGSELLPVDRRVVVFRNLGDLRFEPAAEMLVASSIPWDPNGAVAVGDLDGDDDLDIAATTGTDEGPAEVVVFRNDESLLFTEITRTTISPRPRSVTIEDFDGDGVGEIAVLQNPTDHSDGTTPFLYVFRLIGEKLDLIGAFDTPQDFPETRLISRDLDRDGRLDLAWGASSGRLNVALGRGDGTFDPPVGYDTLHAAFGLEIADLDGDGRPDSATTSISTETVSVQYNRSCYTPCPADLTGSSDPNDPTYGVPDGDADSDDFFFYLDAFATADLPTCDLDNDTDCDADDFFSYLDLFAQGC